MTKHFAIFDVCIDSCQKDSLKIKKTWLFASLLREMKKETPDPWFIRAKTIYDSRTCNEIQSDLFTLRAIDKREDKYRRNTRFRIKYFIHEVDEHGWLKLSKRETIEAEELLRKRGELA